ncbi:MAG: trigger factor [Actinobacteria bacterium]|nr:trigger factor [Actinomycetota bacterium]
MANIVEQLAEDKVKLTVEVPAHDVHHAVEHAANDLAASVRVPGFRQGKVPRPILMQKIGKERLYAEAVESHIGGWFLNAATRARVNPVAQPAYDYELPASESEDWRFSATVEVQPKPDPADWTQLEVPKHEAEIPAEAVQTELEALQKTVGELIPVEGRPAEDGDTVVVDLVAEDGTAQRDYVVELGSERLVEEIENGIRGLSPGESREIAYELQDAASRKATVVVKELKERVLPPLDDELAKTATEFDTLDELRTDIESRLRAQIDEELDGMFRAAAVDELVRASNVNAAGALVETRTRELLNGLARSLEARGIDAGTYLQLTGQSIEQLNARLYAEASLSVGRELILEAVADKLGIVVTDDEITDELRAGGESEEDIAAFIEQGGADRVRDDIRMKKALDRIAAEVKPIAPELHEAREALWTPEQEQPAETPKLWTPGAKE